MLCLDGVSNTNAYNDTDTSVRKEKDETRTYDKKKIKKYYLDKKPFRSAEIDEEIIYKRSTDEYDTARYLKFAHGKPLIFPAHSSLYVP